MFQNGDYGFSASFPQVYTGRPIPHYHIMVWFQKILCAYVIISLACFRSPLEGREESPSSPRSTSGTRYPGGLRTMLSPEDLSTAELLELSRVMLCPMVAGLSTSTSDSTLMLKEWLGGKSTYDVDIFENLFCIPWCTYINRLQRNICISHDETMTKL